MSVLIVFLSYVVCLAPALVYAINKMIPWERFDGDSDSWRG